MRSLLSIFGVLLCVAAWADDPSRVPGRVLNPAPKIDGQLTDGEWSGASQFQGLVDRDTGATYPQPARFWLGYDREFVYFAVQVQVQGGVRASAYRQNTSLTGDDYATISLDPFGKTGSYNGFSVNARGATAISIAGGRAAKTEWLGEFVSKGRITEAGWEAEARIPWSLMRLPESGVRDCGFNVYVYDPRVGQTLTWRYQNTMSDRDFGSWVGVDVPPVESRRSIKLLPYGYVGLDRNDKHIANMGLDLKSNINDQIDLIGTVNPDFRNIENQVLSLDFSYYERLPSDSRPFFQEGANFFSTSMDAPIFSSQRIRKFDTGLKAFGKINDTLSFGFLDAIDFSNANDLVFTMKKKHGTALNFTGAVASRSSTTQKNDVFFGSSTYSMPGLLFYGQVVGSKDRLAGFGRRYDFGFNHSVKGAYAGLEYVEISKEYTPRLGFVQETDVRKAIAFVGQEAVLPSGPFSQTQANVSAWNTARTNGNSYRQGFTAGIEGQLRSTSTELSAQYFQEKVNGGRDFYGAVAVSHPANDPYRRISSYYVSGKIQGEGYRLFSVTGALRPISPLQLNLSYQMSWHFERTTQLIFSANYDLDAAWSVSGRAVRRGDQWNSYLAVKRAGTRGAEYFLIIGDPNAPTFQRSVILKAVLPLEVRF